ncbi:MAG: cell division protein FtsA [Solobacterium sp.]|nr:cell division protein FtsA [Solobacterium sp.]MCH4222997.1 cell division protein FtsA [Solobacterium sp.]
MNDKQIFAAVEIADHEVRLIVGEFFNTRFNIIKVERVPVYGLNYHEVTDAKALTEALKRAAADASKMIGASVKKVILAMPSYGMKRYALKSPVKIEGLNGEITIADIRRAIKQAESVNIGKNLALIQTVCVKYTINGISTRRIPIGEKADELTVDIDLLCADRKLAFDLVSCVESAGLQVMDIYLDVFAVAKEAALFEQAVDQNVIILKTERSSTTLGLLSKGRLTTCFVQPEGVGTMAAPIVEKYGLKSDMAVELLKYSARLNEKIYSSNPVHIWSEKGETRKLTEQELCETVKPNVDKWLNDMAELCRPILQAGSATVIITGEGGEMQGLNELFQKQLKCEAKNYIPETLGGRNAGLTAALGLFYAYKDKLPISGYTDSSLDMDAFIRSVSYRDKNRNTSGKEDTLTNKLKGILFDGKK